LPPEPAPDFDLKHSFGIKRKGDFEEGIKQSLTTTPTPNKAAGRTFKIDPFIAPRKVRPRCETNSVT